MNTLPFDIQYYNLDFFNTKGIIRDIDYYLQHFDKKVIDAFVFNKYGIYLDELKGICSHKDCMIIDESSLLYNYCIDHLFEHQCISCSTIHHNLQDIKISSNVYNSFTSNITNGFAIRTCATPCYIICTICNKQNMPYAIDNNGKYYCDACHIDINEITLLDFEIDYTQRSSFQESIRNIYRSTLFEMIVPNDIIILNIVDHDHIIIRKKTVGSNGYTNIFNYFNSRINFL